MEDADKEKTLLTITAAIRKQIISLTTAKKTGKYEINIEVNLSQGGIGSVFVTPKGREQIV